MLAEVCSEKADRCFPETRQKEAERLNIYSPIQQNTYRSSGAQVSHVWNCISIEERSYQKQIADQSNSSIYCITNKGVMRLKEKEWAGWGVACERPSHCQYHRGHHSLVEVQLCYNEARHRARSYRCDQNEKQNACAIEVNKRSRPGSSVIKYPHVFDKECYIGSWWMANKAGK